MGHCFLGQCALNAVHPAWIIYTTRGGNPYHVCNHASGAVGRCVPCGERASLEAPVLAAFLAGVLCPGAIPIRLICAPERDGDDNEHDFQYPPDKPQRRLIVFQPAVPKQVAALFPFEAADICPVQAAVGVYFECCLCCHNAHYISKYIVLCQHPHNTRKTKIVLTHCAYGVYCLVLGRDTKRSHEL